MLTRRLFILFGPLILLGGCARRPQNIAPPPTAPASSEAQLPEDTTGNAPAAAQAAPATSTDSGKLKITAYINVSSGCQAPTVELLDQLAINYAKSVDVEIVDFGSPEGQERWTNDGLNCMTLLFNGSPVVKFPGEDGEAKTVVFSMPAGFHWTHEDLKQAFKAIGEGKLEVLSEEEARRELAPRPVTLETRVRDVDGNGQLLISEMPVLTIKVGIGDQTSVQRAEAAKAAIDLWAQEPIHPSQLGILPADDGVWIIAKDNQIVQVTEEDARQAGAGNPKKLATEWLRAIRVRVVEAVRKAQEPQPSG